MFPQYIPTSKSRSSSSSSKAWIIKEISCFAFSSIEWKIFFSVRIQKMGYNESKEKCKEFFFKAARKKRERLLLHFTKKFIKSLSNVLFPKPVCSLSSNREWMYSESLSSAPHWYISFWRSVSCVTSTIFHVQFVF